MTAIDIPLISLPIAARAEVVWDALRDPDKILRWFGWDAETLADEVEYIFVAHADADDAARVLRFEGGVEDRFEVEARGQQSILRIVRPAPEAGVDWDAAYDDMIQGWIAFAQQLKFAIEHHGLAPRRTVYFSGSPAEGDPLGAAALGLHDLPLIGQRYNEPVGPEEDGLTGHVWHKGAHQFGVTVDQWGNGLLLVIDRPANARWPTGGTQATLTTYGLDDAELEALETRWHDWWDENFGPTARTTCD